MSRRIDAVKDGDTCWVKWRPAGSPQQHFELLHIVRVSDDTLSVEGFGDSVVGSIRRDDVVDLYQAVPPCMEERDMIY